MVTGGLRTGRTQGLQRRVGGGDGCLDQNQSTETNGVRGRGPSTVSLVRSGLHSPFEQRPFLSPVQSQGNPQDSSFCYIIVVSGPRGHWTLCPLIFWFGLTRSNPVRKVKTRLILVKGNMRIFCLGGGGSSIHPVLHPVFSLLSSG